MTSAVPGGSRSNTELIVRVLRKDRLFVKRGGPIRLNTKPGSDKWTRVVHAKLMLIDDAFMTLGSANINPRSMQTDSELNIAHHRPEVTRPLREQQWAKYTAGQVTGGMSYVEAFSQWKKIMQKNADAKNSANG